MQTLCQRKQQTLSLPELSKGVWSARTQDESASKIEHDNKKKDANAKEHTLKKECLLFQQQEWDHIYFLLAGDKATGEARGTSRDLLKIDSGQAEEAS